MKLLLCEDVDKLGYLGDIVEVKEGYARNFLVPRGLAKQPSEANIRGLADEKSRRAKERRLVRERLEKAAASVEGAEAVIAAKANEQGHLFGSDTEKEIAANLRAQGFEVKDEMVQLPEHIKTVGTHSVTIRLAPDLTPKVSVVVVAQDETVESAGQDSQPQ